LFFIAAKIVISLHKQENPGKKNARIFKNQKPKFMKPFSCRNYHSCKASLSRSAAKILFFSKMQVFFQKKVIFYLIGYYQTN